MHYETARRFRRRKERRYPAAGVLPLHPQDLVALVPLALRGLYPRLKKGCRSIPLDRSRPLSRRSGCFPAEPYPRLSSR